MPAASPRILKRQRILLDLAGPPGAEVSLSRLTTLAFLVAQEVKNLDATAFYSFVPHLDGPVSFTLNHEVRKLAQLQLLELTEEDQIRRISKDPRHSSGQMQNSDLCRSVRQLTGIPTQRLLARIAQRYPAYTSSNSSVRAAEAPISLFTKGYEGLSVEEFFSSLLEQRIRVLIDVRNSPLSRRFGFHKSTLDRLASELGMKYYHFPDVGIPSSYRRNLSSTEDYSSLFRMYEEEILPREGVLVNKIAGLAKNETSVLFCSERDASCCHRSRLAKAVFEINELPVKHL
jgi:hypothetical protein